MPPEVAAAVAAFIVEHHVERPVYKRRRHRGASSQPPPPASKGDGGSDQGRTGGGSRRKRKRVMSADDDNKDESFLARWSRRKRSGRGGGQSGSRRANGVSRRSRTGRDRATFRYQQAAKNRGPDACERHRSFLQKGVPEDLQAPGDAARCGHSIQPSAISSKWRKTSTIGTFQAARPAIGRSIRERISRHCWRRRPGSCCRRRRRIDRNQRTNSAKDAGDGKRR